MVREVLFHSTFEILRSMKVGKIRMSRRDTNELVGGDGLGHDGPRY